MSLILAAAMSLAGNGSLEELINQTENIFGIAIEQNIAGIPSALMGEYHCKYVYDAGQWRNVLAEPPKGRY